MPRYFLDYLDWDRRRLTNIADRGFGTLGEARKEAVKILAEYVGGCEPPPKLGYIEVVDETGEGVAEIHFVRKA